MFIVERVTALIESALKDAGREKRVIIYFVLGGLIELDEREVLKIFNSNIQLQIRRTPAQIQCMTCFGEYLPAAQMICPFCGGVGGKILAGEECYIERIEVAS